MVSGGGNDAYPPNSVVHEVRPFDAQRDGMALVSGWEVSARVTFMTGRVSTPVFVALCRDEEAAREIADLLNGVYGPTVTAPSEVRDA